MILAYTVSYFRKKVKSLCVCETVFSDKIFPDCITAP